MKTIQWNNNTLEFTEDCFGAIYCNGVKGYNKTRSIINWYIKTYKLNVDKIWPHDKNWAKLKRSLELKFSSI